MRNFQRAVYVTIAIAVLILTVSLVNAQLVYGHHVDVPVGASDAEAFVIVQEEVIAQAVAVKVVLDAYDAAASGIEAQTLANDFETAVTTSIEHIASLEVRDCFAGWHYGAVRVFETLADAFAAARRLEPAPYAEANRWVAVMLVVSPYGEVSLSPAVQLFDCEG